MSDDMDFDPAVHATDKEGNPIVNRNGSFRKKRSDAGGRKKTSAAKGPSGAPHRRYSEGVAGLLQIPAMAISIVNPVDGYTVAAHTEPIAKAVADLAVERPEVAAALDRVMVAGPYGALIGAVFPLIIQLGHNHGVVPESMAKAMGATPRRDIERHLKSEAARMAEEERVPPQSDMTSEELRVRESEYVNAGA